MTPAPQRDGESGMALLAVMLGMVVISILALGLVLATKLGPEEARSDLAASEMRAWFDAVVLRTGVALLDTNAGNRPRIDGVPGRIDVLGVSVPIMVTSEFGKVDLNVADVDTISRLLEAAGMGPATAAAEADAIGRWRSGDGGRAAHVFRIPPELMQAPGMTEELYDRIAPAVTVYSGRGRIDQSVAPLLALQSIDGMDRLTAEGIIRDRQRDQTGQTGEMVNGQIAPGINITSWSFRIEADPTLYGRREHAVAVIRMTGDPARPYLLLWREEAPE